MASLKKTKVIDPPCRLGFSTTESVRRRIETYRVLTEDAHGVPYTTGELIALMVTAWMDQDADAVKAAKVLTADQQARIDQAMGAKAEA